MRKMSAVLGLVSLLVAGAGCVPAGGGGGGAKSGGPEWWHSSVTLANNSSFAIKHIFLSAYDQESWGADQLGADVLESGQAVKFEGIECNKYDLRLIDEDGDECVVQDIDLCLEDAQWELTNDNLLACQGWGG
jgi:hypothetical protein